jgi:SAM-dependent methyltransferase
MTAGTVDWGAGNYERTAAELEPVARAVVASAAIRPGERVIDLACGTGNAALLAGALGATVTGVDAAPRLLDVAHGRARSHGVEVAFLEGDLHDLPVDAASADVVLSVFGVVFASDPSRAIHEIGRILRSGGRALISAWVPAGPNDAMLGAMGRVLGRVTESSTAKRFPWFEPAAVAALAEDAGMSLQNTTSAELPIRDSSPDAYIAGGREHPMALAVQPVLRRTGADAEARAAMTAVLREANEDPNGFLVHSPYVVHELHAG